MSSATAPAVKSAIFSGTFDKKENLEAFTNQVKYFIPFAESNGINLEVNDVDKVIKSSLMNKSLGVVINTVSKTLYDNFELTAGQKIGILKLSDFISMFNVFGGAGVNVKFVDNEFEIADIANPDSVVSFKTADSSLIQECSQIRAMSILSNEDVVSMTGNATKNKVTFKVTNSNMSVNTFKLVIDTPVSEDFEVYHRKDMFLNMLKLPIDSKTLSIADRIIKVEYTSPTLDMTVYLAKKTSK